MSRCSGPATAGSPRQRTCPDAGSGSVSRTGAPVRYERSRKLAASAPAARSETGSRRSTSRRPIFRPAVDGAEAVIVVLPAVAHADVARSLADALAPDVPVVLNPGHMCGSLHLKRVFSSMALIPPPIVELGTLSYICRSLEPGAVDVFLRAQGVPTAVSPPDRSDLIGLAEELFPGVRRVASPIEAWLYDVNVVLHAARDGAGIRVARGHLRWVPLLRRRHHAARSRA